MVKVLIVGATGQVGRELMKAAPAAIEVIGYSSKELDITNAQQVHQIVSEFNPALIINAAAYTAVDKAENAAEQAYAVNQLGVKNLAQVALGLNIPVFHISTDYVFDGTATEPYTETDAVGPAGVYGASKLAGEQALLNSGAQHIILRTSWVFGAEGNNFVKTMLRLGSERETLGVVADQYGCPTSSASIASALWQLTNKFLVDGTLPWGIYHFSNAPATTWYDFSCEIFKQAVAIGLLKTAPVVNAIATKDYPTPAKRPSWSVMNCSALEGLLGGECPSWQQELAELLKRLKDA